MDAVEIVARALADAGYSPLNAMFRAKRLLAEITPALVAAEREACAKVAEGLHGGVVYGTDFRIANFIRARPAPPAIEEDRGNG